MEAIEETLLSLLNTNTDLIAIVEDRIKPVELPLDCPLPAISYTIVSDPRHQIAGSPRIQYSLFSYSYPEIVEMSEQIKLTFEGFSGVVNSRTIIRIYPENSYDSSDSDPIIFQRVLDFRIVYIR